MYDPDEPPQKRRKNGRVSYHEEEPMLFGASLRVYDRNCQCLLGDGQYQVVLSDLQPREMPPGRAASWLSVQDTQVRGLLLHGNSFIIEKKNCGVFSEKIIIGKNWYIYSLTNGIQYCVFKCFPLLSPNILIWTELFFAVQIFAVTLSEYLVYIRSMLVRLLAHYRFGCGLLLNWLNYKWK